MRRFCYTYFMKTLKFKPHLCQQILNGKKTATWRLFDDKDLQEGDEINFVNKDTLESFGEGHIKTLRIKSLGTLVESDWEGHERFESEEEMYDTYRTYYGDTVGPGSELKIIEFYFEAC